VWAVTWVDETGSTNADLLALARQNEPEGTVLIADHQTAGRGRIGRSWTAPPNASLLASILLRPPPTVAGMATMAVAVAAAGAVHDVGAFEPRLKWPNDLVWPGDGSSVDRKLAGILAEAAWPGGGGNVAVVVGIGINVNWPADLPDELAATATACNHICGMEMDRRELLDALLARLETAYSPLRAGESGPLLEEWRARSATLGRRVRVDLGAELLEGLAVDVTEEGHLVVAVDEGEPRTIAVGDVIHLRDA
jgi:BirA family transcriptional regulator, biotin operon repressor / biotin---[acetyl-CoA-carboxylase] ligase